MRDDPLGLNRLCFSDGILEAEVIEGPLKTPVGLRLHLEAPVTQ